MEYPSFVTRDPPLEDLPFPIPQALYASILVSSNIDDTLSNAEQLMVLRDYRTAAALFTVAQKRLGDLASHQAVADLLCKRAECLLLMNYVQHVIRDCQVANSMIGRVNEHIAFLLFRAFEMQGEVEEAFGYAVIYKALDPQMERDRDSVSRLRKRVMWLCGQGHHQIPRTIDILMERSKLLFSNNEKDVALDIFTEVLELSPGFLEALEYRAECYFSKGALAGANHDCDRALLLSQRTSAAAFETKIKIKIQFDELEEALELLKEWRIIDPENEKLDSIEMEIKDRTGDRQSRKTAVISKSQSLVDLSVTGHESDDGDETPKKRKVRKPPIRASRRCSGAKTKSNSDLKWEAWKREKEREEIARELAERQGEDENKRQKAKADEKIGAIQGEANEKSEGALTKEHTTPAMVPPPLPSGPLFSARTRKRRVRRKTRNLRAKREGTDDDSDASSVCSISTCPGDLGFRGGTQYRPKMPTFPDISVRPVSEQPRSGPGQEQTQKTSLKTWHGQNYVIRSRPAGVYGPYMLCAFIKRKQPCFQGKLCQFAHSEEERIAWEHDRKKASKKHSSRRENSKREKESEGPSSLLKEWRQQFRGPCRAPWHIPRKGQKYKLCPNWIKLKGVCPRAKTCTGAHGETELKAWNEHLERMGHEVQTQEKKKNEDFPEERAEASTHKEERNRLLKKIKREEVLPPY